MVDGKRACWQTSDGEMQGGLYLEPASKPKAYDLATSTRTIEGIYSLEGDTLRLCYDMAWESKRPGAFITQKGQRGIMQVLVVLKRTYGPEAFPYRLADGTKAFPTIIERANEPAPGPPPRIVQSPAEASAVPAKETPVKVGRILVVGNTKTETTAILKRVPLRPGDVLDYQALRTAEKNLADLRATVTVIDGGYGDIRDIRVTVEEKQR
jgi:hypothetical protein